MWMDPLDPVVLEVARRWDDNQEYLKQMLGPSRVNDYGAYWVLLPDSPFPKFNHVSKIRLRDDELPGLFHLAETFFRGAKLPFMGFMLSPASAPVDLGSRLWAQGFTVETNPVMLLREGRKVPANPKVQVFTTSPAQADVIWNVMLPVFFAGGDHQLLTAGRRSVDISFELGMTNYLAVVDGQIAGTGSVYRRGGIAGIYNMGTLPAFRGQGVASAVLQRILTDCEAAGDPFVALTPTPMAQRLYMQHGFEVIYQERYYGRRL